MVGSQRSRIARDFSVNPAKFSLAAKALARELDRGLQEIFQREFSRAVFFERERKPRDRSWHADGKPLLARFFRIGFAPRVQKNILGRGERRGLPVVDRDDPVAVGKPDQHETAAADIPGVRKRHRERETHRDRGIDGVAALPEDFDTDMARAFLVRHHHAARCGHGLRLQPGRHRRGQRFRLRERGCAGRKERQHR